MKILFVLKQRNYLTPFAGVVDALAARGHDVGLAWADEDLTLPVEISAPVAVRPWPHKRSDEWGTVVSTVRRAGDYLRYLEPAYAGATKLRGRAFDKLLHSLSKGARTTPPDWSERGLHLTPDERRRLSSIVELVERAIPSDPGQDAFLEADRPDVVLVSPLIDLGSAQTEVVKSARRLGIPTGMVLFSWDNLSTKGGLHVHPDRMFVWNERQRKEAEVLHGYPPAHAFVTGAPRFDDFFRLSPATTREQFFAPIGLDPSRPTLLYLSSSKFVVAGSELPFIRSWIREIRASSEADLRGCNIIVRPHPDVKAWDDEGPVDAIRWKGLEGKGQVSRPFGDPRAVVVRTHYRRAQGFLEALHHSSAVVGLNTSASLEAAIAGRPVFTILAGHDAADGQDTTLHFRYLLKEEGGVVSLARDFDEHRRQLLDALRGPSQAAALERFVTSFVRPAGLGVPASDVLARAIERAFADLVRAPGTAVGAASAGTAGETLHVADAATTVSGPPTNGVPAGTSGPADARAPEAAATVRLDFPYADIRLRATSDPERRWRAHACAKEPWTVEWLTGSVRAGEVLYDIGANVGAFSLIAAVHCGATVVAFEPGSATFAHLCENIHLNGCDGAIVPVPLPLAERSGLVGFRYRSLDPGQSRHRLQDEPWAPHTNGRAGGPSAKAGKYVQPACAVALDAAVADFGLPAPHHLKIDVDGAELRVLEGASTLLQAPQLRSVLLEVDGGQAAPVHSLMARHGFAPHLTHEKAHKPDAPTYVVFRRAPRAS